MVSKYGYITLKELEEYASEHYSDIDEVHLNDDNVEAKITAAEELINAFVGTSFVVVIPDGISYSTKSISKRMIYAWMRDNGMELDKEKVLESRKPYLSDEIITILNLYKAKNITPIKLHRLYNNNQWVG